MDREKVIKANSKEPLTWKHVSIALILGIVAILAIIAVGLPYVETAEAAQGRAAPTKHGFVETFEAPDGTLVHKYCDAGEAIYVTPAVLNQFGVGGASIAVDTSTNACN